MPVDLSPASTGVIDCARVLAGGLGAATVLFHVLPPRFDGVDAHALGVFARARAESELRNLGGELERDAVSVGIEIVQGDPGACIVEAADSRGFDLIVMGTRRRRSWPGWWTSGVADAVLKRARCPVVVVRGEGRWRTEVAGAAGVVS